MNNIFFETFINIQAVSIRNNDNCRGDSVCNSDANFEKKKINSYVFSAVSINETLYVLKTSAALDLN